MKLKWQGRIALMLAPLVINGCATSALWENGNLSRFHEPDNPPDLALHQSDDARRVLVQYHEVREGDERVARRAYWLTVGQQPERNPFRPSFVSSKQARGLSSVPIVTPPATGPFQPTGLCAVASTNAGEFTLYSDGRNAGRHELPVYADSSGRTKQILLTPPAVVADATIVGGYLFLWWWSEGGWECSH